MKSNFEYFNSPSYNKERDGKLSEYLEDRCSGGGTFALFTGMNDFNMLKEYGLFKPEYTAIRVMWNVGIGDEFYKIVEVDGKIMLLGMENGDHMSQIPVKGLFKPEDVLEKRGGSKKGVIMNFELHYPSMQAIKALAEKGE
jgi:hypothetical protein